MPFAFEGQKKRRIAQEGLQRATEFVDGATVIDNEHIFTIVDKKTPLQEAFEAINTRLVKSLGDIIDMFASPGLINIDFSDLRGVLRGSGSLAYIESGTYTGESRVQQAISEIFENPLYKAVPQKPKRILFNVVGGKDLRLSDVNAISQHIFDRNPNARIIFGVNHKRGYDNKLTVTLLAMGDTEEIPGVTVTQTGTGGGKQTQEKQKQNTKKQQKQQKGTAKKRNATTGKQKKTADKRKQTKESRTQEGEDKQEGAPAEQPRTNTEPEAEAPEREPETHNTGGAEIPVEREEKGGPHRSSEEDWQGESPTASEEEHQNEPVRRNGVDIQQEQKERERQLREEEEKWDKPAFLRRLGFS